MNPLRRLYESTEGRMFFVLVVFVVVSWFILGCATTPRPTCQPMSPRLLHHRDYVTCITGPYPPGQLWLSADPWIGEREALNPLDALLLPAGCKAYDVDCDGDVDLRDWSRLCR